MTVGLSGTIRRQQAALMSMFVIGLRNLRRNWRNSIASMLAISVGFTAVCLVQGFLRDMQAQFEDGFFHRGMLGHVLVQKKGASMHYNEDTWGYSLDARDQAFLKSFLAEEAGRVDIVVRKLYITGLVTNGRTNNVFFGYGYDVDEGARMRGPTWAWNTVAGKPLQQAASKEAVVIGSGLGRTLDCVPDPAGQLFAPEGGYVAEDRSFRCFRPRVQLQAMTETAQLNAMSVPIEGIIDQGIRELDDKYVVMRIEMAQRLLNTDAVSLYSIALHDPAQAAGFIERLTRAAAKDGVQIEAAPWKESRQGDLYRRSTSLLGVFEVFVLSVVAFVGAMSVINTLMRSVAERTREIGTLRSMGYLRSHIAAMFVAEGLLLAVGACAFGATMTGVISLVLGGMGISYSAGISTIPIPLRIRIVPETYALVAMALCVITTIAAFIPARRAARMRITDALGHL